MTKTTINRVWITGLIVLVAGLIVGGVSLGLMLAYGGHFTPSASGNGQDFIPTIDGFFWTTLSFTIVGFVAVLVGGIVQLTAWVGALINTYQLADKTWFAVLLAGGLIGLAFSLVAFAAMVAYLIAGPDGMAAQLPRPEAPPIAPRSTTLTPSSAS